MRNKKIFLLAVLGVGIVTIYFTYFKNSQSIGKASIPEEARCWKHVSIGELNYYIPMCGYIPINDSDTDGFLNPDKKFHHGYISIYYY